ncbi:unnamed protein product [Somion occarium]|uniref:Mitochondrial K+-H+ exchange-related-domain-containing protein n=1 Tax=Somion occarium TaxID=3059160 RepID=A0ABP1DZ43_9APHY
MGVPAAAKRSMRIIALPLTRATRAPNGTHTHLTYYHFVTPKPKDEKRQGWANWATSKATDLWAGFGKAPEGSWKRKTFLYGERIVDRIDFEELALKSINPSLAPRIFRQSEAKSSKEPVMPTIPLIYPGTVCSSPMAHFRSLLEKRTPRHRKGFFMWMFIAPLTAPFMLIPVIPNLPFFFCVWRSWSHYRAYKASAYLEGFLDRNCIIPEENAELDKIYAKYAPPITPSTSSSSFAPSPPPYASHPPSSATTPSAYNDKPFSDLDTDSTSKPPNIPPVSDSEKFDLKSEKAAEAPSRLLLTREAIPELVKLFQLRPDSSFAADVYRALEQARLRMERKKNDA